MYTLKNTIKVRTCKKMHRVNECDNISIHFLPCVCILGLDKVMKMRGNFHGKPKQNLADAFTTRALLTDSAWGVEERRSDE